MKPRLLYAILGVLVLAPMLGVPAFLWAGNDEPKVARLNALFNFGLLVGAVLASLGLFESISEARRSREDGLRPVLIVADVLPTDEETGENPPRSWSRYPPE